MGSIYQLKPAFQSLLRPLVKSLARMGVSANQVTVFTCLLSIGLGASFIYFPLDKILFCVLPAFLFVRMALNAIDGMLAREHNMQSSVGAFLNELTDVISDTALYYPFMLALGANLHLIVIFICLSIMSEMTGVVALQIGASRRYDGPLGKSDRAFVFGLASLLIAFGIEVATYINHLLAVLIVLETITILNRAGKALREVS